MSRKRRADGSDDAASTRTVVYTPSQIQTSLLVRNETRLPTVDELRAGQTIVCTWVDQISERACEILDKRLRESPPVGWLLSARNLVVCTHAFVPFEMKHAAISERGVAQSMVLIQRRIQAKYAHLGYTVHVTIGLDDKKYPYHVDVQLAAELPPV
jgi:hypothetical protein